MRFFFEKTFISPDTNLLDAIAILDKGSLQIALVVDPNKVLLGILTDGDIRRALLRKISLSDSVDKFMNKDFKFIYSNTTEKRAFQIMQDNSILHLPVLDKNKKIIDLKLYKTFINRKENSTPIIIMAGGKGKRLSPLTNSCPKPMLKIGEKPILEIIIENCIKQGFTKFYLSVNYLKEQIINYFGDGNRLGVDINYLIEEKPLGTAGSLYLLPKGINDNLIVMNGDILTNFDLSNLVDYHLEHKAQATLCAREYKINIPFGVVETSGIEIEKINEKPNICNYVNAGVYMIDKSIIKLIDKGKYFDMPNLLLLAKKLKNKVIVCPIHEYWLDIGKIDSLESAYKEWPEIKR